MEENKRIAKNSIILYIRLCISTIIGLYTSRVVLNELGVSSYGLYSVIGGIVSLMNIFNSTMTAVSFRYLAFELGKKKNGNPNKIFNISIVLHLILALLLIIIVETIGRFYVIHYLNIKVEQIDNALVVLQLSTLATVFTIISTPFLGLITALENFKISAIIGIIQSVLQLISAILLIHYCGNKLQFYSSLMVFVMMTPLILYIIYCRSKSYDIVKWTFYKKLGDYKEVLNYAGWIMFGGVAYVGVSQIGVLIVNSFFGTALNAAFGVANQVSNYVSMFVRNLNQATIPQITKNYSGGNTERSLKLVYSISRYAFFLMLIPSIPIILSLNGILRIWLVLVPKYTQYFIFLMLINGLVTSLGSGFDSAIQATGKIKKNQIYCSIINLLTLPLTYILYTFNYPPYFITILIIIASACIIFVQINILSQLTDFNLSDYLKYTIYKSLFVAFLIIPQVFLRMIFPDSFLGIITFSAISICLIVLSIYLVGITPNERMIVNTYVNKVVNKLSPRKNI
jgi:O-antigen/teichoic acid export membrane protein